MKNKAIVTVFLFALPLAAQLIDSAGPGDQYFTPNGTCAPGGTCRATNAAMGSPPMDTQRYGVVGTPFKYAVPLANGSYNVVLSFAERVKTKPGQRVFTATVQGEQSAPIDLVALTGGPNFPYVQKWTDVRVRAGMLTIEFRPVLSASGQPIGDPVVNAIEIQPDLPIQLTGANGTTQTFTLPYLPSAPAMLSVYWNGLYQTQTQDIDYTLAGDVITFRVPPETGAVLIVR